jgi:hypothetical protein
MAADSGSGYEVFHRVHLVGSQWNAKLEMGAKAAKTAMHANSFAQIREAPMRRKPDLGKIARI